MKEECLPPIECFKSSLGMGRNISLEDYQHAHNVWSTFDCTTFQDYMEVYVELGCIIHYLYYSNLFIQDVLLLAELFSYFKDFCKEVSINIYVYINIKQLTHLF